MLCFISRVFVERWKDHLARGGLGVATKLGEASVLSVTPQRAGHSKMVYFSNYFLNSGTSKKKNLNDGFSSLLESPLTHRITGHTAKFILHVFTKPPLNRTLNRLKRSTNANVNTRCALRQRLNSWDWWHTTSLHAWLCWWCNKMPLRDI